MHLDTIERAADKLEKLREELALVKRGVDRKDDIQEAVDEWLKSFGFSVYVELRHGPIEEVLSMLEDGVISRSRAAEAIGELMVGGSPRLPDDRLSEFGEDEIPGEVFRKLREERDALAAALEPFIRWANRLDSPPNWLPDGCPLIASPGDISDFCVGHLRKARDASQTTLAARDARIRAEQQEQIDALAAAVEHFGPDREILDDDTMYHSVDCTCDRCEDKAVIESIDNPKSILADRDARMKREGAVKALDWAVQTLTELSDSDKLNGSPYPPAYDLGWDSAVKHIAEKLLPRVECGEVEL